MTSVEYNHMIEGMSFTHRHDFGFLDENVQENIKTQMRQLYEHNIKSYVDSLEEEITELRDILSYNKLL